MHSLGISWSLRLAFQRRFRSLEVSITIRNQPEITLDICLCLWLRTSTSQQCAFASAGPLLWNCLPVKTHAEILSSSLSSTPRLLKSFLFRGAYRTGGCL